jgi:hypothetical protein
MVALQMKRCDAGSWLSLAAADTRLARQLSGDELPSAAARRWFSLVDAGDSSKEMEGSAV